jgi:hypothetical protein
MNSHKVIEASRFRSMQILLALFSAVFLAVVAYGYYHLLTNFGWFVALVGGVVIALIAWFLARVAGTADGGDRINWILIAPLFVISAAGVYNSMMVYLEGGQVLSDAASGAQKQFGALETAAGANLRTAGIAQRTNQINSLRDALFSEIRNPLNCGQGPEARRLIAELQRELPGFKPLSGGRDCAQNDSVIGDYRPRIAALVAAAPWNDAEVNDVLKKAAAAREQLAELRAEVSRNYSPERIHEVSSKLESHQSGFQDLRFRLGKEVDVSSIPDELPITAAQSLGNIYKLPALFLSRLDQASTYMYLLVAFGFDILLVYLFKLAAQNRVRRPAIAGAIAGAW